MRIERTEMLEIYKETKEKISFSSLSLMERIALKKILQGLRKDCESVSVILDQEGITHIKQGQKFFQKKGNQKLKFFDDVKKVVAIILGLATEDFQREIKETKSFFSNLHAKEKYCRDACNEIIEFVEKQQIDYNQLANPQEHKQIEAIKEYIEKLKDKINSLSSDPYRKDKVKLLSSFVSRLEETLKEFPLEDKSFTGGNSGTLLFPGEISKNSFDEKADNTKIRGAQKALESLKSIFEKERLEHQEAMDLLANK